MLKSNGWGWNLIQDRYSAPWTTYGLVVIIALVLAVISGILGIYAQIVALGLLVLSFIVVLRWDHIAAVLMLGVNLCVDWYLGFIVVSQVMICLFLLIFLIFRSSRYPWKVPSNLWLWMLFFFVAALAALHGVTLQSSIHYYLIVITIALLAFWFGLLIGRDVSSLQNLFEALTVFVVLLALLNIVQGLTGALTLKTDLSQSQSGGLDYFYVAGTGFQRGQGFFLDPDGNGEFFAMMAFLPLGLLFQPSSWQRRTLHLAEAAIILLGLMFTYSSAAWLSLAIAMVFFLVFLGSGSARLVMISLIIFSLCTILLVFQAQVQAQISHLGVSYEFPLRVGGWETAINIIKAFPLTGLGMGVGVYALFSDQFRAPLQYESLPHPHNSYLELASLGGLPLLVVFLALLLVSFWFAWRNWKLASSAARPLLGCGLATIFSLCVTSWFNKGWTLPPLAAAGWLLLGVLSSPILTAALQDIETRRDKQQVENEQS